MLITHVITFEVTRPKGPRYIDATDGQTERQQQRIITALCTYVHRAVKTPQKCACTWKTYKASRRRLVKRCGREPRRTEPWRATFVATLNLSLDAPDTADATEIVSSAGQRNRSAPALSRLPRRDDVDTPPTLRDIRCYTETQFPFHLHVSRRYCNDGGRHFACQKWKWVSGSCGSPFLDRSRGSWVTASDPLTHDEMK